MLKKRTFTKLTSTEHSEIRKQFLMKAWAASHEDMKTWGWNMDIL